MQQVSKRRWRARSRQHVPWVHTCCHSSTLATDTDQVLTQVLQRLHGDWERLPPSRPLVLKRSSLCPNVFRRGYFAQLNITSHWGWTSAIQIKWDTEMDAAVTKLGYFASIRLWCCDSTSTEVQTSKQAIQAITCNGYAQCRRGPRSAPPVRRESVSTWSSMVQSSGPAPICALGAGT